MKSHQQNQLIRQNQPFPLNFNRRISIELVFSALALKRRSVWADFYMLLDDICWL